MDEFLEYMKWQVILAIKRTLTVIKYEYNFNLKVIDNLKKDDLFEGVKSRQKDNEKLLCIYNSTIFELSFQFGIESIEEIDNYLKFNFENIMQIISCNKDLYELNFDSYSNYFEEYKKKINFINLIDILKKQKSYFKSNYTGYSDTIYKDLLNLINSGNYELIEIYEEIVKNKFFNPNSGGCGTSNEKFWCSLPKINCGLNNIIELNRKVILDDRVDYQVLSNGMSYTNFFLEAVFRKSKYTLDEKSYYSNLVADAIRLNNCSILDTKFIDGMKVIEYNSFIRNILFGDFQIENMRLINDLRQYLLSNEGVNQQIINSRYPSKKRNESIDLYLSAINCENNVSPNSINKLKSLKI